MLAGSPMDVRVQLFCSAGSWMVSLLILFYPEKIPGGGGCVSPHLYLFIELFFPPLEESAADALP